MTPDDFHLSSFLPYRLAVMSERVSRRLSVEYGRSHGLVVAEWRVLVHLLRCGAVSVRDIHNCVNLEKPRVSRAVSRLEMEGVGSKKPRRRGWASGGNLVDRCGATCAGRHYPSRLADRRAPDCCRQRRRLGRLFPRDGTYAFRFGRRSRGQNQTDNGFRSWFRSDALIGSGRLPKSSLEQVDDGKTIKFISALKQPSFLGAFHCRSSILSFELAAKGLDHEVHRNLFQAKFGGNPGYGFPTLKLLQDKGLS